MRWNDCIKTVVDWMDNNTCSSCSTKLNTHYNVGGHEGKDYSEMKKTANTITAKCEIKSVHFDDNKGIVTVVLKDGRIGISRCNDGDEYSQTIGFCIAYTNAVFGSRNKVLKLVKHYNGEEAKMNEEKKLREEVLNEIKLEQYKKKVAESNKKREQKKAELRKEIEGKLNNK